MIRAGSYRPKLDRVDQLHAGKRQAERRRYRGESTGQHKSWEHAPKPIAVRREEQAYWDCFDYWLIEVAQRVREIVAEYVPPHVQAARDELAAEYDSNIPF
jgi:hypothetical protein